MVYCIGHSIISPLGQGSQANYEAVRAGRTGLKMHSNRFADVEPFCASLFEKPEQFVPLCIRCVEDALGSQLAGIACQKDTVFILSTTKGDNLDLLTPAQQIALHFGNPNPPIVVSNACTSGVCAQITAMRLLDADLYKHAIIIGCDLQTRFIVSGFQSFKALSPEPCKPFSPDRQGLNLGEAVACMVVSKQMTGGRWVLEAGSIHNDANHLSAPSRTGEGAFRCLTDVTEGLQPSDITLIGVHGTGTLYNDDMELMAINRAGLQDVPISALKPHFGHTMGAAGVLETILCLMESEKLKVKGESRLIKMLSGFGGVNAAVRWKVKDEK